MHSARKTLLLITCFAALLIVCCIIYYNEVLFFLPRGLHDWAQADRLSLAMNFYDNGMDFFKPATHNLASTGGITGVEFPVQSYLAAVLAKLFGRDHISPLFKLLNIVISLTGLIFLFRAGYRETRDFVFSMASPLFMFCSPIYVYYTASYLPDAAACSVAFMAFYFLLRYIDASTRRDLLWTLALLTLASLIKTSVALYLIAFVGYVFLQRILRRGHFSLRDNLLFAGASAAAALALGGYAAYNTYLNETYHSKLFLAKSNPFKSWDELSYFFNANFKYLWMREYFLLAQYPLIIAVLITAIPILLKDIAGKKRLLVFAIFLLGVVSVGILMGSQLQMHDYYVVSILLPAIAFGLLISITTIHRQILMPQILKQLRLFTVVALAITFFFADHHMHQRFKPNYEPFNAGVSWAEGGDRILAGLGIPKTERIFVLREEAPNVVLVYFDRKGYVSPSTKWYTMDSLNAVMRRQDLNIAVLEGETGRYIMDNDPTFQSNFSVLTLNNKMAIFRRR
jgi:hypothetical protein